MKKVYGVLSCITPLVILGCSGVIRINAPTPNTATELREYLASEQAYIEGLEVELDNAKESRDVLAKSDAMATGYFMKSETSKKLDNANRKIEFISFRLTCSKANLAAAKSKLESIETIEN